MFFHDKRLQYHAKPDKPDPLFARRMQEVLGGQWGEMSVMMMYLFQGWNCRGPQKYRDMILDIGTEEISHVEMLATMIARLLEGAPVSVQEEMVNGNPAVAAVMGGMNPQHLIVSGGGALPADSVGYPWTSRYIVASGNLLADFRMNVTAESQGRLQVTRLYEMTTDSGIRDMFSFMIARDTMHQNQWLAAIEELEKDGLESTPCPSTFPQSQEKSSVAYQFWNMSEGTESQQGRWASGPSIDGKGQFEYLQNPQPLSAAPEPPPSDPRLHGTNKPGLIQRIFNSSND
jgi:Mn-containing catalase